MYMQFLGKNVIPRNKRCEFSIPNRNSTGSKNLEIRT